MNSRWRTMMCTPTGGENALIPLPPRLLLICNPQATSNEILPPSPLARTRFLTDSPSRRKFGGAPKWVIRFRPVRNVQGGIWKGLRNPPYSPGRQDGRRPGPRKNQGSVSSVSSSLYGTVSGRKSVCPGSPVRKANSAPSQPLYSATGSRQFPAGRLARKTQVGNFRLESSIMDASGDFWEHAVPWRTLGSLQSKKMLTAHQIMCLNIIRYWHLHIT